MDKSLNIQTHNITERIFNKKDSFQKRFKVIHSYTKVYPNFIKIIKYRRAVVVPNYAEISDTPVLPSLPNEEEEPARDSLQRSINRTKTKISDLVLCNDFTHFATFTFSPEKVKDRHDFAETSNLLKRWINTEQKNHERTHGFKFAYLIVPERHKNGAWHFHALLKNYKNPTQDFYSSKNPYITVKEIKTAKRYKNRQYLTRYTLGRSELAPIRDTTKMASYIKKYITKELITEPNAKRFWCSRALKRPEIIENLVEEYTRIPQQYRTQSHDYHEIYEIPTDSDYYHFLRSVQSVELNQRKNNFLRLRTNSCR